MGQLYKWLNDESCCWVRTAIIIFIFCTRWWENRMAWLLPGSFFCHILPPPKKKKKKKKESWPRRQQICWNVQLISPGAGLCWVNPEPKGQMRCWRGATQLCPAVHKMPRPGLSRGRRCSYFQVSQSSWIWCGDSGAACVVSVSVLSPSLKIVFQKRTGSLEWPEPKVSLAC